MDHASLGDLIETLEKGTNIHISITFLDEWGNRKTRRTYSQSIHDRPVCMTIKRQYGRLASCYRCRNIVQRFMVHRRKSIAGYCTNGVYEYCRPVVCDDRVICMIFIGNILPPDPAHRKKMEDWLGPELLTTMEPNCSPADCEKIANVLESYILFLLDRYGGNDRTFDPLLENIKSYLRENLVYGFSMEELSAAFNYTPKYLGYIFKSRTGRTIKEYCNFLKTEQAKRLLGDTSLSIEAVAVQAGFNSATYFDRVFRKYTGLSPQAYRASTKK